VNSRKEERLSEIDRSAWPAGPWDAEPDRIEWRTEAGFVGIILRQGCTGHLCGYVGVEPGHPWHGKSFGDGVIDTVDVHGGVTYGEACEGNVCHVPAPGEPEHLWWLGFDAAHHRDFAPRDLGTEALERWGHPKGYRQSYRDVGFMTAEVESLARQARSAA
jgi:hypothetical protein